MKKGLIIGIKSQAKSYLVETLNEILDIKEEVNFDSTNLIGSSPEYLNSERINNFGFKPEISLKNSLIKNYQDYIKN